MDRKFNRKMLATAFAGGLAFLGVNQAQATILNTNIVADPGFENVNAGAPGAYGALPLLSWTDGTDTGFTYASGQYDNGGPLAGGGQRYFTSNQSAGGDADAPGEVAQLIDVSTGASGALIATGNAQYSMSAFFSTYVADGDQGRLHLDFLNAGNASLGTTEIGPGGNVGTWTFLSDTGAIPVGTATIQVSVYGVAVNSGPDGYVDNVDVRIIPEPASLALVGLGGLMMLRRRRN